MISPAQVQQFSRECMLVRKALQDDDPLPEVDFHLLMSGLQLLLADLLKRRLYHTANPVDTKITESLLG